MIPMTEWGTRGKEREATWNPAVSEPLFVPLIFWAVVYPSLLALAMPQLLTQRTAAMPKDKMVGCSRCRPAEKKTGSKRNEECSRK